MTDWMTAHPWMTFWGWCFAWWMIGGGALRSIVTFRKPS
jgi:hypothetical protein